MGVRGCSGEGMVDKGPREQRFEGMRCTDPRRKRSRHRNKRAKALWQQCSWCVCGAARRPSRLEGSAWGVRGGDAVMRAVGSTKAKTSLFIGGYIF